MTELKTLKDIEKRTPYHKKEEMVRDKYGRWVFIGELKAEAVKWVKEDFEEAKKRGIGKREKFLIEKWMKRLDIKEDDLK